MKEKVKLVEVGPRDGLQNEKLVFSVAERIELIQKLIHAGLNHLEGGSFVSPKAIPQMENSEDVWKHFSEQKKLDLSFLVASEKGLERALAAKVKSIAVFTATSDEFNLKNIRRNVEDSLQLFSSLVEKAIAEGISVRGYVSTVFGCPYEGHQSESKAISVIKRLFQMGCHEVSVGDTIGVAHPTQVRHLFNKLKQEVPLSKVAAHLHDTRGMAIANILSACEEGVRIFDSSVGGLGGCPYATGSSGNVATEEVVYLLESLGFETGVSIEGLLSIGPWLEAKIGRSLKSKLYLSQPKKLFFDRVN